MAASFGVYKSLLNQRRAELQLAELEENKQVRHQRSERSSVCQAPVYTDVRNVQHIAACSMC